jgi:sialate O-acetylesterase
VNPLTNNQTSAALFNGMISPLVPYGIKGVIWYQGESNGNEPIPYRAEVPGLIKDWRSHWNQGDFPFLLVQLPNYMQRQANPSDSNWVRTREAQTKALDLPNTGLAVTLDIGDAGNIHPPDKWDVAHRLALQAQRVAYGQTAGVYAGPTFKSLKVEGDSVRISFDNVGTGLVTGNPPARFFTCQKKPVPQAPAAELKGFAVAGADQKYYWAQASIIGNEVFVKSTAVPNPATVRYAWADNPDCNLYNREGLPAAPFRTDDYPLGK